MFQIKKKKWRYNSNDSHVAVDENGCYSSYHRVAPNATFIFLVAEDFTLFVNIIREEEKKGECERERKRERVGEIKLQFMFSIYSPKCFLRVKQTPASVASPGAPRVNLIESLKGRKTGPN